MGNDNKINAKKMVTKSIDMIVNLRKNRVMVIAIKICSVDCDNMRLLIVTVIMQLVNRTSYWPFLYMLGSFQINLAQVNFPQSGV